MGGNGCGGGCRGNGGRGWMIKGLGRENVGWMEKNE